MTLPFEELRDCEDVLEQAEELLYRQIADFNWDPTVRRPRLHAFGPADADKGMPSYARSTKTDPVASRKWHNDNANSESVAVYALSVAEVAALNTRAIDDSSCTDDPSPGHCFVDFRHLGKPEERVLRGRLYAKALARLPLPSDARS